MTRINLYNYRAREVAYCKMRSYVLIICGVVLALVINGIIYTYLQLNIMYQQTRNSYLATTSNNFDNKLQVVNEFNAKIQQIKGKIELLKQVDEQRDDMVALVQQFAKITPNNLYFLSIIVQNNKIEFNGAAASPLYVADFLQNLRDAKQIFHTPVLKSNTTTNDGNSYNFTISAELNANPDAEVESSIRAKN